MKTASFPFATIFVLGTIFLTTPVSVYAQKDRIAEKLVRATETYEKLMEKYRLSVNVALDMAESQARKQGPDQLTAVKEQRSLFENYGCTPRLCKTSLWSQRSSAHGKMMKAYQIAIKEYKADGDDAKAQIVQDNMRKIWPDFLEEPLVGGWTPYNRGRIEVHNGVVVLTATRGLTGIVTRRSDLMLKQVEVKTVGSSDVNAWIGVQLRTVRGQFDGMTCQIRAENGGVKGGFMSRKFAVRGDTGNKVSVAPLEELTERILLKQNAGTISIRVNG